MTYKPLPESLTIKDSKVHGLGLFAKQDIVKEAPVETVGVGDGLCAGSAGGRGPCGVSAARQIGAEAGGSQFGALRFVGIDAVEHTVGRHGAEAPVDQ